MDDASLRACVRERRERETCRRECTTTSDACALTGRLHRSNPLNDFRLS